ncbi:VCBS repeat-containing protein [Cesiribacter andamanensis]|uniref:FG-GAP repeat protein n=1 Tax=Cesiribacter andamanensis AMV16 TaxID=1279009 RepID=M7NTA3_9BACT|nr:VCBS repeat-containing protein [Cesiribacter andamanensis]EMR01704.1 FG-GAP repeat protein [Cesiribacter andamanensis AMV16]
MNIKSSLAAVRLLGLCLGLAACGSTEDPRFALVSPEQSGIHFENRLEETVQLNIFSYLYFYNGGGVAAGDLNGDGLPDLYFTANQHENKLYLNRGDFKFDDITEQTKLQGKKGWTTGVTMADVNGDGRLDIYVSQLGDFQNIQGKNQLYINQGNDASGIPQFKDEAHAYGLALIGFSTQAAFFDYDGDGDLDMYMLNHSVHANGTYGKATLRAETHPLAGDKLMRNDGGKFVDVTRESGIHSSALGYGLGITVADINWDGWPDIYVGNDFHENDYLYLNNGDGTFTEALGSAMGHTTRYSMGNDVADINNDGLPDILSVDMLPSDPEKLKASAAEDPYEVYNFKLDYGYNHQFARNTLQLNQGGGKFSEIGLQAGIAATDWSWSGLFADLDLDGYKDIYIANGIKRRSNDLDYINFISSEAVQSRLEGNLTEDDLLLTEQMPVVKIPNAAFRNRGDLSFEDVSQRWGLNQDSFSNGAAYADLDGDGDLDLITNNIDQPAFLYKNLTIDGEKQDNNWLKIKLEGEGGNRFGIGTKIIVPMQDQTRTLEHFPTRGYQSAVSDDLTLGAGQARVIDTLIVVWPDGRFQKLHRVGVNQTLTLRQAEAGGKYSFAPAAPSSTLFTDISPAYPIPYTHQENKFEEFNREPLIPHMASTEGPALAVSDVNGDGLDDIFAGGAKRQPGQLLLQTAGGFVPSNQPLFRADSLAEDTGALFLDYDGDGDLDLVVVSGGNEFQTTSAPLEVRFYKNGGGGTFSRDQQAAPGLFTTASCVRAADFDRDGDLDLFIAGRVLPWNYGLSPKSFLLENTGDGRFKDITASVEGLQEAGMITDAAWADLGGNGYPALVLVGEWMPVTVFANQKGRLAKADMPSLEKTNGWWNVLQVADLNGDGLPDLLAGNLGLNSKYKASAEEPVTLYVNDFDGNGKTDPLIYHYIGGKQYLFATKDELVSQLRAVKGKFVKYEEFAKTDQTKLFENKLMEAAEKRYAYEFRSGAFLNDGKGGFRFQPFPAQAQFSPIRALHLLDADGNGQLDVLSAGNFWEVNIQRGRYDAGRGTLLLNKGAGAFAALSLAQSGLLLEGQVRDIQPIRLQGRPALVVARNNAPLQVLALTGSLPAVAAEQIALKGGE